MKRKYLNKNLKKSIVNALLTMESTYKFTIHCATIQSDKVVEVIHRHREAKRMLIEVFKALDIDL